MFLDRLKTLFRKNDGKQKLKTEYTSPRNEYYGTVAERYSTMQMVLLVLLTLFVLVCLIINSEWISYENFFFFFSDYSEYLTSADSDIENVIYDTGDFYDFGVFGGKFAVAGRGGVSLYTRSGRTAFSDTDTIPNPKIETSERFMLVYDAGGKSYRVYNVFTEVYSEKTEYQIYGAAAADNGSYAIITGDGSHTSCVMVYNRRFEVIQTIGRASYIVDVSMTPSGDRVAVLSYSQENGEFITQLSLVKTSKNQEYANIKINGTFPLYCSYTEKGCVNLVCEDRIVSYNTKGDKVSEFIFPENASLKDADVNRYGCTAVLGSMGGNIVLVFDRNGQMVYNDETGNGVTSVAMWDKHTFLLDEQNVTRIELSTGNKTTVERDTDSKAYMIVLGEDEILLCMSSRAKYIKI